MKAAWNGAREEGRSAGKLEGKIEGRAEGRAEGRVEGKIEGKAEGMQEVAKKMKEKNMPLETIIELTGLSVNVKRKMYFFSSLKNVRKFQFKIYT